MANFETIDIKGSENPVRVIQARVIFLLLVYTFLVLNKTDDEKPYLAKEVDL